MSVAMRRALVTLRGRCGREGGRTHRVSYGEHDGVEPPELGLILRGEIPECHVHGSPLLVVAVHLAATSCGSRFFGFFKWRSGQSRSAPGCRTTRWWPGSASGASRRLAGAGPRDASPRTARRLTTTAAETTRAAGDTARRPRARRARRTSALPPRPPATRRDASAARYRRCNSRSPGGTWTSAARGACSASTPRAS